MAGSQAGQALSATVADAPCKNGPMLWSDRKSVKRVASQLQDKGRSLKGSAAFLALHPQIDPTPGSPEAPKG